MLNLQAQDYLISFAGSGESPTVDSVIVENLTQGTKLKMKGSDVLHLLGIVTGIETIGDNLAGKIAFSPNPMKDLTRMQFVLPEPGKTIITMYDFLGRETAQTRNLLSEGQHTYRIQGVEEGIYFVRISSGRYSFSGKLVSSGSQNTGLKILYENTIAAEEKLVDSKGTNEEKVMQYNTGDRLKFTAISGNYRTVITDVADFNKIITFDFFACTDGDINNYSIVQIGTQTWMAENLKTTKYLSGDLIGTTSPATQDISLEFLPRYQWAYNGNESNVATYGRLYTWYAIIDSRAVCPTGWYIPKDGDWTILTNFLNANIAGSKLKETGIIHWTTPNLYATNEMGFTALPGGWHSWDGTFKSLGSIGFWQTASEYNTMNAYIQGMYYNYSNVLRTYGGKKGGFSVRCLKISVPRVITTPIAIIGTATATAGGNVISDGGATVTEKGIYYGLAQNPVTTGTKVQSGSGEGIFEISLKELTPDKTYHVMAYATNSLGTSYGNEEIFMTLPLVLPDINTAAITSITQTSAISGGDISYDGGAEITARGVCWGTSPDPTTNGFHTSDGVGSGNFVSNLTGLIVNTKYFVRSYATNTIGTQYGNEICFATSGKSGTLSDADGNTYSTIIIGTQIWMAENLKTTKYNDNTSISNVTDDAAWVALTSPAYCWYNNDAATYKAPYGALYNWYTVNTGKLCPTGWHVPSEPEFRVFDAYLCSVNAAGKVKEAGTTHWNTPNAGATNETGWTGLPGGMRYSVFDLVGNWGCYQSTMDYSATHSGFMILYNDQNYMDGDWYKKQCGFSVRCLKDEIDNDGDGFMEYQDCDDANPAIHPGAKEICGDKIDNNCDGIIDERGCETPLEICDGVDNDFDGQIDEGCKGLCYFDTHANKWRSDNCLYVNPGCTGNPISCSEEDLDKDGYTSTVDCNDFDNQIHPNALEIIGDGIDQDCDGVDQTSIPSSFDWRNFRGQNWMSPVKSQGQCGACYAFASVAAIEAKFKIQSNNPALDIDLSEQEVISCSSAPVSGTNGCSGGSVAVVLSYIRDNGIVEESCFPFVSGNIVSFPSCNLCTTDPKKYKIDGYIYYNIYNNYSITADSIKKALVSRGPIIATVPYYDILIGTYSGGIMTFPEGQNNNGWDAQLIVGYNDTEGYWILRPSFGALWGENGYYRLSYSNTSALIKYTPYVIKNVINN